MSKNYNGDTNKNSVIQEKSNEAWDPGESHLNLPENIFRGFERVPIVLCEQMDITPFLSNNKQSLEVLNSPRFIKIDPETDTPIFEEHEKLLSKCSVSLKRDDLDNLLDMVKNKIPIPNGIMFKCDICHKYYCSEKKLKNHIESKHILCHSPVKTPKRVSFSDHVIVHEVKEYHRCRKCTKIFEDYRSLKNHMKEEHRKRKCYICFYCTKDFVDRTFFKVHVKQHCDACGLFLPNRKKYQEHRRYVCKIAKRYECKTCQNVFFNFMDMKDHSYEHLGSFFICDVCKDQFDTKCSLAHHIKFLHIKKRPLSLYTKRICGMDRVFVCNFCEESSIDESQIENHIFSLPDLQNRVMTGYKDYYFCDQCLKKFGTETDMLQHKWTHFLKNSENQQKCNENIKMKYKVGEELPHFLKPKVVVERLELPKKPMPEPLSPPISNDQSLPTSSATLPILQTMLVNSATISPTPLKILPAQTASPLMLPTLPTTTSMIPTTTAMMPTTTAMITTAMLPTTTATMPVPTVMLPAPTPTTMLPAPTPTTMVAAPTALSPVLSTSTVADSDMNNVTNLLTNGKLKHPLIDPVSKKTLLSKHQCEMCGKYLSTNYTLKRHKKDVHNIDSVEYLSNLQCEVCEETFVWPSLLKSHKCIRMAIPEMPFQDARPEIHFDNMNEQSFDSLEITENMDYMNSVDFDIPAPIVELTEYDNVHLVVNGGRGQVNPMNEKTYFVKNGYNISIQEVPIEF